MEKTKGQSLVEFALLIPAVFFAAMVFVDGGPLGFNIYMAKQMSARGARAASIYKADGSRTCVGDVIDAIGDPGLIKASWAMTITGPCDGDPSTTIPPRTPIIVTIEVEHTPLFLGGLGWPPKETVSVWNFEISTTDQAR